MKTTTAIGVAVLALTSAQTGAGQTPPAVTIQSTILAPLSRPYTVTPVGTVGRPAPVALNDYGQVISFLNQDLPRSALLWTPSKANGTAGTI